MDRTAKAREWVEKMAMRVNPADIERLSRAMLDSIDRVSNSRWELAVTRAAELPGDVRPEKLKALTDSFARELGAVGAGVGATAATPLIGTGVTLLAATAEIAWFTARAGDLVLTVAALHGRSSPSVAERRAWMLAVLIYGSSARDGLAAAINQSNTGLSTASDATRLPMASLNAATISQR